MKFLFDQVMKFGLPFVYPLRQLLIEDLPLGIGLLHFEHDPVAPLIAHVHMEKFFRNPGNFSEVEFPDPSAYFHMSSELYIFLELNMHKYSLNKYTQQFSCYSF